MIWTLTPVVAGVAYWLFEQILFDIEEWRDRRER